MLYLNRFRDIVPIPKWDLTLTSVVFEYVLSFLVFSIAINLTLTSVVFELNIFKNDKLAAKI